MSSSASSNKYIKSKMTKEERKKGGIVKIGYSKIKKEKSENEVMNDQL